MTTLKTAIAVLFVTVAPAFAQDSDVTGDAEKGAKVFKKCQSCHVVTDPDGNVLAGKKSKTGPNLYGIAARAAGSVEGFKYGKSLLAAGEAGLVWDQESFASFVQDPKKFLQTYLGDKKAKSKMTLKLRKEKEALDVYALLASLAPADDAEVSE
ncbi:MAG: c-type cytochrome [Thalassovita sp.]